jgi:hypothetical protein
MHLPVRSLAYAHAQRSRFVAELADSIRFPAVGAQSRHSNDLKQYAAWLANHLHGVGFEQVEVIPTPGYRSI